MRLRVVPLAAARWAAACFEVVRAEGVPLETIRVEVVRADAVPLEVVPLDEVGFEVEGPGTFRYLSPGGGAPCCSALCLSTAAVLRCQGSSLIGSARGVSSQTHWDPFAHPLLPTIQLCRISDGAVS